MLEYWQSNKANTKKPNSSEAYLRWSTLEKKFSDVLTIFEAVYLQTIDQSQWYSNETMETIQRKKDVIHNMKRVSQDMDRWIDGSMDRSMQRFFDGSMDRAGLS